MNTDWCPQFKPARRRTWAHHPVPDLPVPTMSVLVIVGVVGGTELVVLEVVAEKVIVVSGVIGCIPIVLVEKDGAVVAVMMMGAVDVAVGPVVTVGEGLVVAEMRHEVDVAAYVGMVVVFHRFLIAT